MTTTKRYHRVEAKSGTESISATLARLNATPCASYGVVARTAVIAIKQAAKSLGRNAAELYVCHISH